MRSPTTVGAVRFWALVGSIGARFFGKAAALILVVAVARWSDPSVLVGYSYLVSLVVLLSAVLDIGTTTAAAKAVADDRRHLPTIYASALPLVVGVGVIVAAVVIVTGIADDAPGSEGLPLFLAAAFVVATCINGLQSALVRAAGRVGVEAMVQVIASALLIVVAVPAIYFGATLTLLMVLVVAREVAIAAAFSRLLPTFALGKRDSAQMRRLVRFGLVASLGIAALFLLTRAGTVYTANLTSVHDAAAYAVSVRWLEVGQVLGSAAGMAMMAGVAHAARESIGHAIGRFLMSAVPIILGVSVLAITGWAFARPLNEAVFGGAYAASAARPTQWIFAAVPALSGLLLLWYLLATLGAPGRASLAATTGLLVTSVVLAWPFVSTGHEPTPSLAALGCAFGCGAGLLVAGILVTHLLITRRAEPADREKPNTHGAV